MKIARADARNPPGVTSIGADFGDLLLLRLFERDLGGGDLAKCRHDFLIITFHEWPRAFEQLLGAFGGSEDQFEAVGDLLKAIFYGNSRHYPVIFRRKRSSVNAPVVAQEIPGFRPSTAGTKFKEACACSR